MKIKIISMALLAVLFLVTFTACGNSVDVPFLHNSNVCITDSREAIISGLRLSYDSDAELYITPGSVTIAGVVFEGVEVEFIGNILDYIIYFIDNPNDDAFDTVFAHLTSLFGRPTGQEREGMPIWLVSQDDVVFLVELSLFEGIEFDDWTLEPSLYLSMTLQ